MSRTRRALPLCTLLLSACGLMRAMGIGGEVEEWRDKTYDGLNRADMLQLVKALLDHSYQVTREDPKTGEVETAWSYGRFAMGTHQQLRQKVYAKVLRGEEDGVVLVRMRVAQEVNDDPGFLFNPASAEWITYDDDPGEADLLIKRLDALLYGLNDDGGSGGVGRSR